MRQSEIVKFENKILCDFGLWFAKKESLELHGEIVKRSLPSLEWRPKKSVRPFSGIYFIA